MSGGSGLKDIAPGIQPLLPIPNHYAESENNNIQLFICFTIIIDVYYRLQLEINSLSSLAIKVNINILGC